MTIRNLVFCLLTVMVTTSAQAASVIAVQNQDTQVVVNLDLGSILQLPAPVRTVTPSQYFQIQDIGAAPSDSPALAEKGDVRTFLVRPIAGAQPESVTFVLASGRALALRLIPSVVGEKFYDIQLDAAARHTRDGKFLGSEMGMMRAMLVDEGGGFAREIMDEKIDTEFPDLEFRLARIYATGGLTGYVFRVSNRTMRPLELNLSSLAFSRPNRAVVVQADRVHLEACPLIASATPACQTAIRLVVRGPKAPQPLLGQLGSTVPPFARPGSSPVGGGQ